MAPFLPCVCAFRDEDQKTHRLKRHYVVITIAAVAGARRGNLVFAAEFHWFGEMRIVT